MKQFRDQKAQITLNSVTWSHIEQLKDNENIIKQAKQLTYQSKHCANTNNKDQLVSSTSEVTILNETLEKERFFVI